MERRLPIIFLLLLFSFVLAGQTPLPQTEGAENLLRIEVWSLLETEPGREIEPSDIFYEHSVNELKKLAPFILEGMIFGWDFSYTPYDSQRNVQEYFEFTPKSTLPKNDGRLSFKDPRIENERFYVWLEYARSPVMLVQKKAWDSVVYPKISGTGRGRVADGTAGIITAYEQALKQAVRSYAQGIEKNKPKEIQGSVLLIKTPRLYIDSGFYTADLDFFLQVGKIIPYALY